MHHAHTRVSHILTSVSCAEARRLPFLLFHWTREAPAEGREGGREGGTGREGGREGGRVKHTLSHSHTHTHTLTHPRARKEKLGFLVLPYVPHVHVRVHCTGPNQVGVCEMTNSAHWGRGRGRGG